MRKLYIGVLLILIVITPLSAVEIEYAVFKYVVEGDNIQTVINSCFDASASKRYAIMIGSGTYIENITIPPYIGVFNTNELGKIILRGKNAGTDIITMRANSELHGVYIQPTLNKDAAIEITGSHVRVDTVWIDGSSATIIKGISQLVNITDVIIRNTRIISCATGIYINNGTLETQELVILSCTTGVNVAGGILYAFNTVSGRNY